MNTTAGNRRIFLAMVITAMLGIAGCAGTRQAEPVRQYLDASTGITLRSLTEPVIFYHDAPRLAAHARDYIYAGPVEMNRMGKYSYYVWLARWSTIDRITDNSAATAAVSIDTAGQPDTQAVIFLDGVPMELQEGFAANGHYRMPASPYSVPVDTLNTAYLRVSRDQLNRIAAARTVTVSIKEAGGTRDYTLWSGTTRTFASITQGSVLTEDLRLVRMSD